MFVTLIWGAAVAVAGAQTTQAETGFLDRTVVMDGTTHRFEVFVPSTYRADVAWPVLVDLHGNGAQGEDGMRQTAHFLAHEIRMKRRRFPLIVVFPQAPANATWASPGVPEMVLKELDSVLAEFRCDRHRIYLSGFSMGGAGVYAVGSRWPGRFAAGLVIGGFVPAEHAALLRSLRGLPLKVIHGTDDERLPVEGARSLMAELREVGAAVEYVEYPGTRHGPTADRAYADEATMAWLLSKRRE